MKGKKGQFYLLAAMIIAVIVVGLVTISNYSSATPLVTLYDLEEELEIESQNVIDYGTYNNLDLDILLEQFIEDYVSYTGSGKNLYFLFGDSESVTVKAYQEVSEDVLIDGQSLAIIDGEGEKTYSPAGGGVVISVEDINYPFVLQEGENFYFIVSQEIDGGKYVISG